MCHASPTTPNSMAAIGATGDPNNAYECGNTIGTYLKYYGFDIDFAPVADVNTNPENIIIGPRAFSDDPQVAAPMVTSYLQGLKDAGITGCIKHFPGHGDTKTDTHFGYASTQKTWEEMMDCEMVTSCKTSCAANWVTRTSSSPTVWRWEPLLSSTPVPRLP